jgi:hypothetical protein
MTFTDKEQKECRQMTWSAACHADFIGKSLDELLADYTKLNVADDKLAKETKTFEHNDRLPPTQAQRSKVIAQRRDCSRLM